MAAPKVIEIAALCAQGSHLSVSDLLSRGRTMRVVRPRQTAMYLARKMTSRSLPDIGRFLGGLHHATVLCAVRRTEARIAAGDKDVLDLIAYVKKRLG